MLINLVGTSVKNAIKSFFIIIYSLYDEHCKVNSYQGRLVGVFEEEDESI